MADQQQEKHEGLRQAVRAFAVLSGIGIYFAVFVAICIFLGYEADIHFDLGHTGRLIGALVGFPGAIYTLYRQLKKGQLV
ncbi:MAG: AtpZ/AtpI family protein [Selenomonadaceae bacterium]|nr:AtpZ/AtpI family protein [Selenomonadaceae bacterium]MDY3916638.1 AtpZ/AtpI family protein [Selenomonadaceae bacterium]